MRKDGNFLNFSQLVSLGKGGACMQTLVSFLHRWFALPVGQAGHKNTAHRGSVSKSQLVHLVLQRSEGTHLLQGPPCPLGTRSWFLGRGRNFVFMIKYEYAHGTEVDNLYKCPGASLVTQTVKNPPAMWETQVRSLGWEDCLEKEMATHSSTVAWKNPMDRGAWRATVHGGDRESDTAE